MSVKKQIVLWLPLKEEFDQWRELGAEVGEENLCASFDILKHSTFKLAAKCQCQYPDTSFRIVTLPVADVSARFAAGDFPCTPEGLAVCYAQLAEEQGMLE